MQDNQAQSPPLNRLADFQSRIHQWCTAEFPEQTAATILAHLGEEVAGLRERGTPEEAADCLILLLAWAGHTTSPLIPNQEAHLLTWITDSTGDLQYYATLSNAKLSQYTESAYLLALLIAWSWLEGHDLLAAAEAKHAVNLTRSWRRDADGIHRHDEEGQ